MSIINGASYARFRLTSTGATETETTVDVPLTNYNSGLVESYEMKQVQHDLISLDISNPAITKAQDILGFFIRWTFSYTDLIDGDDLMLYRTILNSAIAGDTIVLTPRVDEDWRTFEVILESGFDLGIRRGGINAIGHKGFTLTFVTKEMQTNLNWAVSVPADTRTYPYGDDGYMEILYET